MSESGCGCVGLEAEVPMYYYYLLPVEAVETFGRRGRFGAVCIEPAR